jgi:hypothetical protein
VRGLQEGFHVGNATYFAWMTACPIEAECGAPVVDHKQDVFVGTDRFQESVDISAMLDESVAPVPTVFVLGWQLV